MQTRYHEADGPATQTPREQREEAVENLRLQGALKVEDAVAVALGHAPAGKLIRQALFWDGKGELPDEFIHKTSREWRQEAGLTRRNLDTATRKLVEAEALETQHVLRPRDRRYVVAYRLNPWAAARLMDEAARKLDAEDRAARGEETEPKPPEPDEPYFTLYSNTMYGSYNVNVQSVQGPCTNRTTSMYVSDALQKSTTGEYTEDSALQAGGPPDGDGPPAHEGHHDTAGGEQASAEATDPVPDPVELPPSRSAETSAEANNGQSDRPRWDRDPVGCSMWSLEGKLGKHNKPSLDNKEQGQFRREFKELIREREVGKDMMNRIIGHMIRRRGEYTLSPRQAYDDCRSGKDQQYVARDGEQESGAEMEVKRRWRDDGYSETFCMGRGWIKNLDSYDPSHDQTRQDG